MSFVYFKTYKCFKDQMVLLKDDLHPGGAEERERESYRVEASNFNLLAEKNFKKLSPFVSFTQSV